MRTAPSTALLRGLPLLPLAMAAAAAAAPGQAIAAAGFDLDLLRERGIDPQVAEYFKDSARFRPGVSVVTLWVNGQLRGRADARFNDKGELCLDKNLLDKGNIKLPEKLLGTTAPATASATPSAPAGNPCYDFLSTYPQAAIELRPGKEEVALVVPTDALRPNEAEMAAFQRGGTAAIVNYDVVTSRSQYATGGNSFLSANLELGFNTADWIVRAREMYSRQDNKAQRQHLYAYAQHTLVDYKSIFQGGQINVLNTTFATGPITGVQLVPETALSSTSLNNVMAQGIAQTQARVEVRQNGALIYSTIVPSGPFALTDLPLLNTTSDLDVTVIEANGAQRRFTVPAAALYAGNLGVQTGYSVALGKQRALGNATGRQPWLATVSGGWTLGRDSNLSAGVLGATGYQGLSWGLNTHVAAINLSMQQRLSHQSQDRQRGTQFTFAANTIVAQKASISLSGSQQTLGFRELGESSLVRMTAPVDPTDPVAVAAAAQALAAQNVRYRGQYSASLGWNDSLLGGLSLAWSRSTQYGGPSTQRATASWGRAFDFGTVNLNLERQLGGTANQLPGNSGPSTIFYLTVTIPLGRASARGYVNNSGSYQRQGLSFSDALGSQASYSVSAERNGGTGDTDMATQLAALPRYAQLNLGYARYGSGTRAYSGGLRGGMVWHKDGLTLSPYAVQDTFGLLQVGDVSGVQVSTPYGPVWTDWKGQAVVAQLPPYSETRLEVATKTLPRNVDLRNGLRMIDAGRGAVAHVEFQVLRVRRILLNARDAAGRALPRGAPVLDADKQFVTTVVDDGQVFLINGNSSGPLRVILSEDQSCVLQYALPEQPNADMFYETADALCRPELNVQWKGRADAHS